MSAVFIKDKKREKKGDCIRKINKVGIMNPTSRLKRIGITKQRQQSASIRLMPRILSGGDQLSGMIKSGRRLLQ